MSGKAIKILKWIAGIPASKAWWSFFLAIAAVGEPDHAAKAVFCATIAVIYWMPDRHPIVVTNVVNASRNQ